MTLIEYLNKLTIEKTIESLYACGVIGDNWLRYRDIWNMRDLMLRQGVKRQESIYILSIKFRVSDRHIYRALKKMEQQI